MTKEMLMRQSSVDVKKISGLPQLPRLPPLPQLPPLPKLPQFSQLQQFPFTTVGQWCSRLPVYPGSLLFVAALNRVLKRYFSDEAHDLLSGKKCRIKVLDLQLTFLFEWTRSGFVACRDTGVVDLTIAATLCDFMLLAQRKEDPDTLFFSRRLVMEGDTELGLLIKNTLDAIEFSQLISLANLAPWPYARIMAFFKNGGAAAD